MKSRLSKNVFLRRSRCGKTCCKYQRQRQLAGWVECTLRNPIFRHFTCQYSALVHQLLGVGQLLQPGHLTIEHTLTASSWVQQISFLPSAVNWM